VENARPKLDTADCMQSIVLHFTVTKFCLLKSVCALQAATLVK